LAVSVANRGVNEEIRRRRDAGIERDAIGLGVEATALALEVAVEIRIVHGGARGEPRKEGVVDPADEALGEGGEARLVRALGLVDPLELGGEERAEPTLLDALIVGAGGPNAAQARFLPPLLEAEQDALLFGPRPLRRLAGDRPAGRSARAGFRVTDLR